MINKISPCKLVSLLTNNNSFTKWFIERWHDDYIAFSNASVNDKGCGGLVNKWTVEFLSSLSGGGKELILTEMNKYRGWRSSVFDSLVKAKAFINELNDFQRLQMRKDGESFVVDFKR